MTALERADAAAAREDVADASDFALAVIVAIVLVLVALCR